MANLEELVIELSAETKQLQADMKAAIQIMEKSTNEMQKSIEGMAKDGAKDSSFLQNAFASMTGYLGSQAVLAAIGTAKDAIVGLFNDGIEGAIEAQSAFVAFSQALINSGNYSEEAANKFRDFADAQQNLTGISAEAYLSTGKLLNTMAGLSGSTLQDATKAIADLSVVMGTDMDTAAKLFSKGVENSTDVFKRFGLTIEDGASKAERTSNIIEALNSRFGGAAASQANTYSGALEIMKKSFGEVTESAGKLIVENLAVIEVMKQLSAIFLTASGEMESGNKQMMEGIALILRFLLDLGAALVQTVNQFVAFGRSFGNFLKGFVGIKAEIEDLDKLKLNSLTQLEEGFTKLSAAATVGLQNMKAGAEVADTALAKPANGIANVRAELTAYQEEVKAFAAALADSANTQAEIYALDSENLKSQFEAKLLSEEEYLIAKQALQASYMEQEQSMLDQAIAQGLIKGEAKTQAELALLQKQNAQQNMMIAERNAFEKKQREENLSNASTFFGNLAGLSKSGNKELGAIAKAAAIAQATIDTYAGATKALAQGGIWGGPIAASIVASGLANVAKIVATPLATGIDSVPGIGSNDNFPAVLAPGERVVPTNTNADLTEFLKNQSSQPRAQITVNVQMNDVFTSDPREMGRKIIEVINEASQANGITILGSSV